MTAVRRAVEQSSQDQAAPGTPDIGEIATGGSATGGSGKRSHGTGNIPPADLYRTAIEEYRFQAQYNWSRTQYLLAFNAAVLAVATGLFVPAGVISALVFALGGFASWTTLKVIGTQHEYYRAARNRLMRVESDLEIPEFLRFDTTKGLGGQRRGRSVNDVIRTLLFMILLADVAGFAFAISKLLG